MPVTRLIQGNLLEGAFQAILQNSYRGIIIIDDQAKIVYANDWYVNFYGITSEQLLGKSIDAFFRDSLLKKTLLTGTITRDSYDTRFHTPIVINRFPITKDGQIIGAIALFRQAEDLITPASNLRRQMAKTTFSARYTLQNILTEDPQMLALKELAAIYARSDAAVLITGESGVGKEMFAQGIHNESFQRNMPFVAINCAALPENLLESELFGYAEASFTGAKKGGKSGLFQLAHHGTLFLDEIGEMPPTLQSKLLRVLQEKVVRPVGAETQIPIDVRIIAATNQKLYDEMEKGTFRKDLFYRLSTLSLNIPPLRERKADIPLLADFFLKKNGIDTQISSTRSVLEMLLKELADYPFHGNIRELENIIKRFSLLFQTGKVQTELAVNMDFLKYGGIPTSNSRASNDGPADRRLSAENEAQKITRLLAEHHGNKNKVAEALGCSVPTLYRHMKKLKIHPDGGEAK